MLRTTVLLISMLAAACLLTACGEDNPSAPPPAGAGPDTLSFNDFQAAVAAIGQPDLVSGAPDAGGTTGPLGMNQPYGAPANGSLYIADPGNHRVLGFNRIPASSGVDADFVLGQADFTSNQPGTSELKLTLPVTTFVAGQRLLVSDSGNSRILVWNSLPSAGTPADVVIGQQNFLSKGPGTSDRSLSEPANIFVAGGRLFVSDFFNNRVMIWNTIPTANGQPADVVVGQEDFTSSTPTLSARGFGNPRGVWASEDRLVIADDQYDRVLIWNSIPTTSGVPADIVVGAADFATIGSNIPSATSIGRPFGVLVNNDKLYVSDADFHRVLIFPFPTANGAAATGILGQAAFTNSVGDDLDQDGSADATPSAQTFANGFGSPGDMRTIGRQLFVVDQANNRCLVFESN